MAVLLLISGFVSCTTNQAEEQEITEQIKLDTIQTYEDSSKNMEFVLDDSNVNQSDETDVPTKNIYNDVQNSQITEIQEQKDDDDDLPDTTLDQRTITDTSVSAVKIIPTEENSIEIQKSSYSSDLPINNVVNLNDFTDVKSIEADKIIEKIEKHEFPQENEFQSSQSYTNLDQNVDQNVDLLNLDKPITKTYTLTERTIMTPIFYLFIVFAILIIVLIRILQKQSKLKGELIFEQERIRQLGIADIEDSQKKSAELKDLIAEKESNLSILNFEYDNLKVKKETLETDCSKIDKRMEKQKLKLSRAKELYRAIEHAVERFHKTDIPDVYYRPLSDKELIDLNSIAPTVMLNLNYMNYQELRKEFRANQKQIDVLLDDYAKRYTTKANQSIYKLMVISLRSELQNILYNLKYEKLDNALNQVEALINKYLAIASDGNQQIAGTMKRFIGELGHLFNNSVKIEYEYYIKKEQAKQEQLELRQQMMEEAEERKQLAKQTEQIAFEESKYKTEIEKIKELLDLEPEDSSKRSDIIAKLEELNIQLSQVEVKKDEITKLQKGKAGNVYIISNLGAFGDHVFKIGMTRRLDPQERVNELSNASVPFKYDVHSFIFSEDAVGLENELHKRLHKRRLNKVNLRKEFFDISLDELEQLVEEINPTAEFNRTMLAEDYNQSLSMDNQEVLLSNVDSSTPINFEDEDEDKVNSL